VIELGPNRYGKSAIRLVKVDRQPDRHDLRDLTVSITLDGDFGAAFVAGDNANVVATDTMKNVVYGFARDQLVGAVEGFGQVLARHFLDDDHVSGVSVSIEERRWSRIPTSDGPAADAFFRTGDLTRTALVSGTRESVAIAAGWADLTVMKTRGSAFRGFPRDAWTTLPETDDRLLATRVSATWRYAGDAATERQPDYEGVFDSVHRTFLEVFAEHDSPSVQATIWIVGRAILERHPELDEIRMVMPNLHHWLVDLSPFGQPNPGEVFVATTEPYGLIEATVRRSETA